MGSATPDIQFLRELGDVGPPVLYRSLAEIDRAPANGPYLHAMRQAWRLLGLSGIYCVQDRPTIYFVEAKRNDPEKIQKLHKQLWNQGTATVLILILPAEIHVYSGLVPPSTGPIGEVDDHRRVEILQRTADALELRSLIRQVETGFYFEQHQASFSADQTVDQFLLENLRVLRDRMRCQGWDYRAVHTFLGRIIFICYLVDRRIIGKNHFETSGGSNCDSLSSVFSLPHKKKVREVLARLFKRLRREFNGSMFVEGDHADAGKLTDTQIEFISRFFEGEELEKGQRTLGFWGYDFSVIPIETISAIYEEFLAAEDPSGQRMIGAFYTKRHLAEFVVDIAVEAVDQLHLKKCLDPACGSGIFLVILFSRMAESWRREYPRAQNGTRAKALIDMLKNQLCGVDKIETACRITCFSLYLTLLDQLEPRDIEELLEKYDRVLPDILALKVKNYQARDARVIMEGDFFDTDLPLANDFDLVIGNPPWVSRGGGQLESVPKSWYSSERNPYLKEVPHKKDQRAWFMPNGELSITFLWKAPLHLRDHGHVCLLVPSKVLLNKGTNEFQAKWFSRHDVQRVVQLADLSFVLFENADCPTTVMLLSKALAEPSQATEFLAPKTNRDDPRPDVIAISPEDVKTIDINPVHYARSDRAPMFWKKLLWASPRDLKFLDYLQTFKPLSELVGSTGKEKRWIKGQGFKPWHKEAFDNNPEGYGPPKTRWWGPDLPYISARDERVKLVLAEAMCQPVGARFKEGLYRNPDRSIFEWPKVLFNQGYTKFAYCDFPVLFQHSLQSIAGPEDDRMLLKFLAAYLNSNFARYFLFHTAANWGTERDKVHFFEVLRLPFPLPDQFRNPRRQHDIQSRIARKLDEYGETTRQSILEDKLAFNETLDAVNALINDYFDLSNYERVLLEDTLRVIEPSSTPPSKQVHIETLRIPTSCERLQYVDTLCAVLNDWACGAPFRVSASIALAQSEGMAVVTLTQSAQTAVSTEHSASDALESTIHRLRRLLREKRGGLHHLLELKVFDRREILMLKRLQLREWTRTAALNDADEIAAAILRPKD